MAAKRPRTRRKSFALSRVYGLLEPGPVVLLTTARKGQVNVMAMSWHTMLEFEPPTVGCVVSDRNFSFAALKATKECVINIPTVEIAEAVAGCGNCSGKTVDKFAAFGLTALPASRVSAPLVAECYANLECRVIETRLVRKYCFFILEVCKAWIHPARRAPRTIHHLGQGAFMVAGRRIKLRSKMK
jgi:flavin reductase (DIM6/NTAB) family NADH-FMN oxidoreductase RutF